MSSSRKNTKSVTIECEDEKVKDVKQVQTTKIKYKHTTNAIEVETDDDLGIDGK
jgi:hypothetical protein